MRHRMLVALPVAIALAGCHRSVSVVGKWKGRVDTSASMTATTPKNDMEKAGQEMGKALAEGFSKMLTMDLDLKADKTYTMTVMFINMEGTYLDSGSTVTLTPTKVMGRSIEELKKSNPSASSSDTMSEPLTLKVSEDGKTMTGESKTGSKSGTTQLIFSREAETE